eukprot:COSAG06_NODE_579_length_14027_cov_2.460942_7_plen_90_part_00
MHAPDYLDMPVCCCLLLCSLLAACSARCLLCSLLAPRYSWCCADPSYAKEFLGWEATRGYEEMCEDLWRWQSDNPDGFTTPAGSPRSLA